MSRKKAKIKSIVKHFKLLNLFFILSLLLFSCSNPVEEQTTSNSKTIIVEAGKSHNEILDNFYAAYSKSKTILTKDQKLELAIQTVDNYLLEIGSDVSFSEIYYGDDQFKKYVGKILSAGKDLEEVKLVLYEMHKDLQTNPNVLEESVKLIDIMSEFQGDSKLNVVLDTYQESIVNSVELSDTDKNYLLMAIDVAQSSNSYWNIDPSNTGKSSPAEIAGADASGAVMAVQTGTVFYASMLCPWCGAAALVGVAAVASIMAA